MGYLYLYGCSVAERLLSTTVRMNNDVIGISPYVRKRLPQPGVVRSAPEAWTRWAEDADIGSQSHRWSPPPSPALLPPRRVAAERESSSSSFRHTSTTRAGGGNTDNRRESGVASSAFTTRDADRTLERGAQYSPTTIITRAKPPAPRQSIPVLLKFIHFFILPIEQENRQHYNTPDKHEQQGKKTFKRTSHVTAS